MFARAAWETLRDMEIECKCAADIRMIPTMQRGVFFVAIEATSTTAGEQPRKLAAIQGSYPNARAATLSAYIFALANSLAQMVTNCREEEYRKLLSGA